MRVAKIIVVRGSLFTRWLLAAGLAIVPDTQGVLAATVVPHGPEGTVVLSSDIFAGWQRHRTLILALGGLGAFQAAWIAMLLSQRARLRHSEQALRNGEERYREAATRESEMVCR